MEACSELRNPKLLGNKLALEITGEIEQQGEKLTTLIATAWSEAFIHLPQVFDVQDLPDTPEGFYPIPETEGTLLARVSVIASIALIDLDAVSYGSENDGQLFVNLVVIPGEGRFADKSRQGMKGHTDAVSFPVRGNEDPVHKSIAPSPDFVCLAGMRNPDHVRTRVMPLKDILAKLDAKEIEELKKPQFVIRSQATFIQGTKRILGDEHLVDGGELLFDIDGQVWVRYSHSSTDADDENSPAANAISAFEEACKQSIAEVEVAPGDVLLINNRLALHGRSPVNSEPGKQSRWLLRTYGLNTADLAPTRRYGDPSYMLYP